MTKTIFRRLSTVASAPVLLLLFVSPLNGSPLQQDDGTALYEALNEEPDLVRRLLEQGADPDSRGPDGMPVLVTAVGWDSPCFGDAACIDERMSILRLLLEYGADANVVSDDGITAVMVAWTSPEMLDLLIENGADVNARDVEGRTVLMRVAGATSHPFETDERKARNVIRWTGAITALLEHGADPSMRDAVGRTALEYAERRGFSEVASLLPWTNEAALRKAIAACNPKVFCGRRSPASVDSLSYLLEQGADPDAPDFYGRTVLMHAADAGYAEIVEVLLVHGADPNVPVKRAERLFYLYFSGSQFERGDEGATALMVAVLAGHAEIVEMLLAQGADVNVRAAEGLTAWLAAAFSGSLEIIRVLVEHGADLEATFEGATVLTFAVVSENAEIVDFLLEHGADANALLPDVLVNKSNGLLNEGITILMAVASGGKTKLLETLLEHGADVNAQDAEGKTALLYAVDEGRDEVAEILRNRLP